MRKILVECKPDQVLINILFDFEKKIIELYFGVVSIIIVMKRHFSSYCNSN